MVEVSDYDKLYNPNYFRTARLSVLFGVGFFFFSSIFDEMDEWVRKGYLINFAPP